MQLMRSKMLIQNCLYLVPYFVGIMFSTSGATTACQVYPSEYAYEDGSVSEQESASANCRRYPSDLQIDVFTNNYIHCDGAQRILTDSNLGQEQYQTPDYYIWLAGSAAQLLFIFPTSVSFTTITLHYYSDGVTGLPRLSFYAVPDDFDVWDAPTTTYPQVGVASVPPGGEPAGRRSVNITVNFNTKKLLMYKFRSTFTFAVSEAEFFARTGTGEVTTASTLTTTNDLNTSTSAQINTTMLTKSVEMEKESTSFTSHASTMASFTTDEVKKEMAPPNTTTRITAIGVSIYNRTKNESNSFTTPITSMVSFTTDELEKETRIVAIGVSIVILLILSTILMIIVIALIWIYKRRSPKQKLYTDCSYSTLSRASGPQTRTRPTGEISSELYDQIHLSPSTGQTEYIPKSENTNINSPSTTPQNSHPIYSTVGEEIAEHSSTLNAISQGTTPQLSRQTAHEGSSELTYTAIDKSKAGEKGPTISPYATHEVPSASAQEKEENVTKEHNHPPHTIEELYTAVKKKDKVCEPKDEEEAPPVPPHTVEELYAAIQKKPKGRSYAVRNKDDHNIPPHTEEEAYVAGEKPLQNTKEDPYTAVTKKPKHGSTENTEPAPPIPPHTVEELYTAVMKTPKSDAKEEKAPPKPPCTAEKKLTQFLDMN